MSLIFQDIVSTTIPRIGYEFIQWDSFKVPFEKFELSVLSTIIFGLFYLFHHYVIIQIKKSLVRIPKHVIILVSLLSISILSASRFPNPQSTSEKNDEQERLRLILSRTGEYCYLLENAVIDFVCLEEIKEEINWSKDYPRMRPWLIRNNYVYDYQFVKKNHRIEESRVLLEENGRKKHEKNAKLKTSTFQYQNVLYGPIDLLSWERQDVYEYRIKTDEEFAEETIVVLEAIPKSLEDYNAYGKILINKDDFSILKIEWNPKSIRGYVRIEETAERYESEPDIIIITEFNYEKNSIRFPSKHSIQEAYVDEKGKRFIRSELTVIYRDYKFFTVETETIIKRSDVRQ